PLVCSGLSLPALIRWLLVGGCGRSSQGDLVATVKLVQCDGDILGRRCRDVLAHVIGANRQLSRSEEHTSELQSRFDLVCRLLLDPASPRRSTLSLHDALPICPLSAAG